DAQAVKVESGHPGHAELAEQPAAHHGADDAEQDVEEKSFARLVDDLAGDESGDEPENDPRDERHETSSCRSFGRRRSGPDGRGRIYNTDRRPRSGQPGSQSGPPAGQRGLPQGSAFSLAWESGREAGSVAQMSPLRCESAEGQRTNLCG